MKTKIEDAEALVARMVELTCTIPEGFLKKYIEETCGILIKGVKAERLSKFEENKHTKLKGRFNELLMKNRVILRGE